MRPASPLSDLSPITGRARERGRGDRAIVNSATHKKSGRRRFDKGAQSEDQPHGCTSYHYIPGYPSHVSMSKTWKIKNRGLVWSETVVVIVAIVIVVVVVVVVVVILLSGMRRVEKDVVRAAFLTSSIHSDSRADGRTAVLYRHVLSFQSARDSCDRSLFFVFCASYRPPPPPPAHRREGFG